MGARTEILDTHLSNCVRRRLKRDEVMLVLSPIADNFPLDANMPPTIALMLGAARDVLMPAEATTPIGTRFTIVNLGVTAGATMTLKTSADAALNPAVTVAINASVEMILLSNAAGTAGWRKTVG